MPNSDRSPRAVTSTILGKSDKSQKAKPKFKDAEAIGTGYAPSAEVLKIVEGFDHRKILTDENAEPQKKWTHSDFIIPASDQKGHSERQWFRCQPGHDRQMDILIASKRFPFRTKGDYVRWAVCAGFLVLEKLEPNLPSVTGQVDVILQLVREAEFQLEMDETFKRVGEAVSIQMAAGDEGEARNMISRVKFAIDQMPEGAWREKYIVRYKKQFGAYLKSTKDVKMLSFAAAKAQY